MTDAETTLKTCRDCGEAKPLSAFEKKWGKDYTIINCRRCRNKYHYERRKKTPAFLERRARQARVRRQREDDNIKNAARSAVRRAIKAGELTPQACERCGATDAEAHHDDYSKPLDVRWLCPPHHREHHGMPA